MLRKINPYFALSLLFTLGFQAAHCMETSNPSESTQQKISKPLVTFLVKDQIVELQDLRKFTQDNCEEGSIQIQFKGQIVDESFKFESLDEKIQQQCLLEFTDFFFELNRFIFFNLKLFNKISSKFIYNVFIFDINDKTIPYTNKFLKLYYSVYLDELEFDLENMSLTILNMDELDNTCVVSNRLLSIIQCLLKDTSRYFNEFQIINGVKYLGKTNRNHILKCLEIAYNFKNENILNAFTVAFRDYLNKEMIQKIYQKYRENSPVLIKAKYYFNNPEIKNTFDQIRSLIPSTNSISILAQIYELLYKSDRLKKLTHL